MSRTRPLLRADAVSRRYGSRVALLPTSLVISEGETLGLVGPNGAGKSTLLALLAGATEPTSGGLESRPGLRIGWAPQRTALYGRLSARENLEFFVRLEGERASRSAAAALLADFELPLDSVAAADLSAGTRQRLNLAAAMIGEPEVLLLDEPTASLDPERRRRFWQLATRVKEAGGALVFATQNLDELDMFADRVLALRGGAVVFEGAPDDYLQQYAERLHA
ncbi:MAG: ABC transporter ATP-binding protein [Actinobacteria bacterium]|nr:ABC transporter ATP-binding protein [Actinomycetota bacterium]